LHELSLVQGIINAVSEVSEEKGGRVQSVRIGVGELAQFDIRLVRGLLKDLKKGTPLEGARVSVEQEKSRVKCLSCGRIWDFKQLAGPIPEDEREVMHFLPELLNSYSKCPACSKSYFEIEEGRSVRIIEMVLDG
jgi:hydrogenase nickel incorporation protein HypA/HybF